LPLAARRNHGTRASRAARLGRADLAAQPAHERGLSMPRRFCTAADSLAFARRLQRTHERTPPPPVPRVLRRWTQTIVQRLWLPLHFALQLIQRATLAWHAPRAAALPWAPAAPGEIRERFHLSTRLLERSLRVVRTEHTRMLPHAAPVAIGPAMT